MPLKPQAAYECAKQFTITAMEHSMIAVSKDPKEAAKNVADFFISLLDTFTSNETGN